MAQAKMSGKALRKISSTAGQMQSAGKCLIISKKTKERKREYASGSNKPKKKYC